MPNHLRLSARYADASCRRIGSGICHTPRSQAQCVFAHRLAVDSEKPARFRDAAFPIVGYVGAGFAEIHIGLFFFKFCDIDFLSSRLIADLSCHYFPSAFHEPCDVAVKSFLTAVDEFLAVRGHIQNGAIPGNALAKSSSTFLPINIAS